MSSVLNEKGDLVIFDMLLDFLSGSLLGYFTENVLKPVNTDYIYSELINPIFTQ